MSRILIVDDNETMRSGIALVIERMGCEAVKAASGAEALLILARQAAFDMVITDFKMAEMDGLQLLEAIRRDFADTDVVIITAGIQEVCARPRNALISTLSVRLSITNTTAKAPMFIKAYATP